MTFYSKIFGTKIDAIMTWGNPSPCGEGMVPEEEVKAYQDGISEEDKDRIMHMSFMLDNGTCIMASDTHPIMHKNPLVNGNNYQIALEPDTKEEADRLFEALSEGGSDAMPLQDMWWGSYHGSCTDKFAVRWMFDMPTFSSDEAKMKQNLMGAVGALRVSAKIAESTAAQLEALAEGPAPKKAKNSDEKNMETA